MKKEKSTNKKEKGKISESTIKNDVQVDEQELKENLKGIEKEIVHKTELPKEEEFKINKKLFENIFIANIIMVFLYFINLGALNIETNIFLTDLRVFSIILIIFTIIIFEKSYKKESLNLLIHGLESFVLSLFMLFSIYLYSVYFREFDFIVAMVSLAFAIYYVAKAIFIYIRMRKKYFESLNDISDIIKK